MTCAGSRKGGCSFRKCKCRRRPCLSVCICISMLDGRKGRRKRSLPVSFICLEETEFNEETKLSPVENVQRGKEEERRRGGGKQIRNRRRVYSKTVVRSNPRRNLRRRRFNRADEPRPNEIFLGPWRRSLARCH